MNERELRRELRTLRRRSHSIKFRVGRALILTVVFILILEKITPDSFDVPHVPFISCVDGKPVSTKQAGGIRGAVYEAGSTLRSLSGEPPSAEDITRQVHKAAVTVGTLLGETKSAFDGAPPPTEQSAVVKPEDPTTALPAGSCSPCAPSAVLPAGTGVDGPENAARAVLRAGRDWDPVKAVAIAGAESGWRHNARNPLHDSAGNSAYGLFQTMLPMHRAVYNGASWSDPYANARVAHTLWKAGGWAPWASSRANWAKHTAVARAAVAAASGSSTDKPVIVNGQRISAITARQLRLAERVGHINLTVVQGGYGGNHVKASGTSHNYPGVVDVSPGSITVERLLRQVGFAAWARNIPGRSSVGSGAHVHAVSLLEPGDKTSPQVYGSWAHDGNGLGGTNNDPAPHYAWLPNLAQRVGGSADAQTVSTGCSGGSNVNALSIAGNTSGASFGLATFNILGASHTPKPGYAGWGTRLPHAIQVINRHGPDLIGFQEMQPVQAKAFDRAAGGTFARWSGSHDTDNSIAWRRNVFSFVSGRTLAVPYFDGHPRNMPVVRLRYIPTGQVLTFLNVHNPADTAQYHHQARWRAAALRVELPFLRQQRATTYWTGDMNAHVHDFARPALRAGMTSAQGLHYKGIDWTLSNDASTLGAVTVDRSALVKSATDHPFVMARINGGISGR